MPHFAQETSKRLYSEEGAKNIEGFQNEVMIVYMFLFQLSIMAYYTTSSISHFNSSPTLHPSGPIRSSTSAPNDQSGNILSNSIGNIAGALILSIVFLLGVPGNLFVIWSIVARARRRSVTTLLILNLACADGSLMALTPFFIIYLIRSSWVFGLAMCKVLFYLCCANMYASIFLITLMSLHRLVAVVWPQHLRGLTTQRTVVRALLVIWFLALALATPVLVFRKVIPNDNKTDANGFKSLVCTCNHSLPGYVSRQCLIVLGEEKVRTQSSNPLGPSIFNQWANASMSYDSDFDHSYAT